MSLQTAYTQEVKLNHNESAAKIDNETGEVTVVRKKFNNIPKDKELQKFADFNKVNIKAIEFLDTVLTNEEMGIVFKMIKKASYGTNIMIPLSDELSYRQIAEEFKMNKNKVPKIFSKLFTLGVYIQTISSPNGFTTNYWTLNPYISWKGKLIDKTLQFHFKDALVTKAIS